MPRPAAGSSAARIKETRRPAPYPAIYGFVAICRRQRHNPAVILRRCIAALLFGLPLIAFCVPASSQTRSAPGERFFRIDWHVERRDGQDFAIVGQLRNDYLYSLRQIQLQIQVFDTAGQVTAEVFGAVDHSVPPGGSARFRLPLGAPGARYAVLVHAFEFGDRESP